MLRSLLLVGFAALAGAALAATDAEDGRLLDELIGTRVSAAGAPGAAAVLVRRDGRVTLRAYGFTDLAAQRVVDAENTVFRVGSLTKTFTAIAVLQLVDEGKISLEADANLYLKGVQIPGPPVRVIDLLTHRGGFDGDLTYVGLNDRLAAAQSSDERLQRDLLRVRPAGLLPSYDNLAWGLLGHIVESVDGLPYAQAIKRRIFEPLRMNHSVVGLPADLAPVATAYEVGSDGKPQARPQIFLRRGWQGAGDISTTAGDMGRFIKTMLAEGEYPGGHLLRADAFRRQVVTSGFGFHPGLRSIGLGVYALGRTGGGGFGHGGTIRGFNASMVVLPKEGLALFAVMNLNNPAPEMSLSGLIGYVAHPPGQTLLEPTDFMTIELPHLMEQRFQPIAASVPAMVADARDWSGRYTGLRVESYAALLPRLAVTLLLKPKTVRRQADGTLFVDATGPYRSIGSGLYSLDGPAGPLTKTIAFADIGSDVLMGPHTLQANRRLAWYERPVLTAGGLLLAPLLLLLAALAHRRKSRSGTDSALIWSALFLLAGIFAEISVEQHLYRVGNLGWIVSAWRLGMAIALLVLLAAAGLGLRRAFVAAAQRIAIVYALVMALLTAWICLAVAYWNLLGRI